MPSNAILEQKKQVVADLAEQIKASAAGVVVNYQGITVENDIFRRKADLRFLLGMHVCKREESFFIHLITTGG